MSRSDSAPSTDPDFAFLRYLGWLPPHVIEAVLAKLPPHSLPNDPPKRQRWLLYAVMQHIADSQRMDPSARANEDRLDAYLDAIADEKLPADLSDLGCWLKYLPGNRAKKHARRRRLLERFRNDLRRPDFPRPDEVAEEADERRARERQLAGLKLLTTEREWRLLNRAASESLEPIAKSEGLLLGTLKSLLSRCRARLRQAC